jgi:hypothetical protein
MAQIYISDSTKELLVEASFEDSRSQEGEIKHLCKARLAEIAAEKAEVAK